MLTNIQDGHLHTDIAHSATSSPSSVIDMPPSVVSISIPSVDTSIDTLVTSAPRSLLNLNNTPKEDTDDHSTTATTNSNGNDNETKSRKRGRDDSANSSAHMKSEEPDQKIPRNQRIQVPQTSSDCGSDDHDSDSNSPSHSVHSPTGTSVGSFGAPRERRLKSLSQLVVLKNFYALHPRVSKEQVRKLITQTGLTHREVTRWFRNERHKEKKMKAQAAAIGANNFPHIQVSAAQQAALLENERKRGEAMAPFGMNGIDDKSKSIPPMPMFDSNLSSMPMSMQSSMAPNGFYRPNGGILGTINMNMNMPMNMGMPMQPMSMGNMSPSPMSHISTGMPMNGMCSNEGYFIPSNGSIANGIGLSQARFNVQQSVTQAQQAAVHQQFHTAMQATTNLLIQANPGTAPYLPYSNGISSMPPPMMMPTYGHYNNKYPDVHPNCHPSPLMPMSMPMSMSMPMQYSTPKFSQPNGSMSSIGMMPIMQPPMIYSTNTPHLNGSMSQLLPSSPSITNSNSPTTPITQTQAQAQTQRQTSDSTAQQ